MGRLITYHWLQKEPLLKGFCNTCSEGERPPGEALHFLSDPEEMVIESETVHKARVQPTIPVWVLIEGR